MPATALFADWTSPPQTFPATLLIEHLVRLHAADVCRFRRNTQASYRFVDTARDLVDKINELINKIEEEAGWDDFEKYIQAIDRLEEILLEYEESEDLNEDVDLLDSSSVDNFTNFIARWEKNRGTIRKRVEKLRGEKEFSNLLDPSQKDKADLDAAYKHDDRTLLSQLVAGIKADLATEKIAPEFPKQMFRLLGEISHGAGEIEKRFKATTSISANWDVLAIKSLMAVYGLIKLGRNEDISSDTRRHLKLQQPWMTAKNLLNELLFCIAPDKAKGKAEQLYKDFLAEFLGRSQGNLPESYKQLIKMVAKIGRSYHAQSLLLVTLCRELAESYLAKQEKSDKHYLLLQFAFDQTLAALQESSTAMGLTTGQTSLLHLSHFDISAYEAQPCIQLFKDSAQELSSCFQELGLDEKGGNSLRLQTAFLRDRDRMEKVNSRIDKISNPIQANDIVEVTVKIRKGQSSGEVVGDRIVKVLRTTRLTAIGWSVSQDPALKSNTPPVEPRFEHVANDSALVSKPAHTEISSLTSGNKLTLFVIV
ncbi:hypothetical protein FRC12_010978 [Ceratobasidium sp. 428]|nr:hypothetical protein FRC12_010978 [Ceratobasidium sp. 428]